MKTKWLASVALMASSAALVSAAPTLTPLENKVRHELVMLPYLNAFDDISFRVDGTSVTLFGEVTRPALKSDAGSAVKHVEGVTHVENQIEVLPPGAEHDSKKIDSDLDKGIAGNLDAALIQGGLHKDINYAVKNQVVTMTGEVDSQSKRTQAQDIVAAVPNVLQVVNELQVKEQKATSSN